MCYVYCCMRFFCSLVSYDQENTSKSTPMHVGIYAPLSVSMYKLPKPLAHTSYNGGVQPSRQNHEVEKCIQIQPAAALTASTQTHNTHTTYSRAHTRNGQGYLFCALLTCLPSGVFSLDFSLCMLQRTCVQQVSNPDQTPGKHTLTYSLTETRHEHLRVEEEEEEVCTTARRLRSHGAKIWRRPQRHTKIHWFSPARLF